MAYMSARGATLHYETLGAGPAVLMIHGFTNHGLVWAEQIADLLGAGYRVILVDLPGHGLSQPAANKQVIAEMAADMIGILDKLQIERAAVCGLSLGGMVAQTLAVDYPQRISVLVAANTSPNSNSPTVVKEIDSWIEMFQQPGGPLTRIESVWPKMLNEAYRQSPTAAAFKASWMRIVEKIPGSSFANVARGLQEFDISDKLHLVRAPSLVISSEFDRLFPPPMCKQVADLIPGARFSVIDGGCHLSSLDSPKAFNQLLLDFLQQQRWA
jgi:3-oxoadipate enol-lactonase